MISAALVLANLASIVRQDFPKIPPPADQLAETIMQALRELKGKDNQTST